MRPDTQDTQDQQSKPELVSPKQHILGDFSSASPWRQFKITAGATDEEQGFGGDSSLYVEHPGNVFYVNHEQFIAIFTGVGALHEDRVVFEETFPNVCPQIMQAMVECAMMNARFIGRIDLLFPFGYRLKDFVAVCDNYGDALLLAQFTVKLRQFPDMHLYAGDETIMLLAMEQAINTITNKTSRMRYEIKLLKTPNGFKVDLDNSEIKQVIKQVNNIPQPVTIITPSEYQFRGIAGQYARMGMTMLQIEHTNATLFILAQQTLKKVMDMRDDHMRRSQRKKGLISSVMRRVKKQFLY